MEENSNFLFDIIESDLAEGRTERVHTRFPPEPNGYLHIGSAKAIYINYTAAKKYGGLFNLRYDDTNPSKEDDEYVVSIREDLEWLGAHPDAVFYGSDYFEKCYEFAVQLIRAGKAYVCDLSADEMREMRGTLTEPGIESPYRNRSVEENLALFERMKDGEFPDGYCTLRAKIDMASPNMNLRDPAIYRILHTSHHRQGNKWCIYPLYDFAHPIQDALEGITHSMCSIEFENHRPLYDWVVDNIGFEKKPHQYEFARLNVTNTVMSKRYLRQLVETGVVDGWDDPRMPTVSALRRRGYTPESIRRFCETIGVARRENVIDVALLEFSIREHLNRIAPRVMAVLDPVKLVIDNYPEGKTEMIRTENNPEDPEAGFREVPFSRELYIEREDFMEEAPKKFFRLRLGGEVRLKSAYIVRAESVVKDAEGRIVEIHCTYDPDSLSGSGSEASMRKVKGTLHWVSVPTALEAEVRLYDRLFNDEMPDGHRDHDFKEYLNPDSLKVLTGCKLEPSVARFTVGDRMQFHRLGYFCVDPDSTPEHMVFNRTVGLKDSWAKEVKKQS